MPASPFPSSIKQKVLPDLPKPPRCRPINFVDETRLGRVNYVEKAAPSSRLNQPERDCGMHRRREDGLPSFGLGNTLFMFSNEVACSDGSWFSGSRSSPGGTASDFKYQALHQDALEQAASVHSFLFVCCLSSRALSLGARSFTSSASPGRQRR